MTTSHTPGPWKFGWETSDKQWAIITTPAGSIVANVNTETGPDASSAPATRKMPADANARLIAAAPDMYAALELCVRSMGSQNVPRYLAEAARKAQSAIYKARFGTETPWKSTEAHDALRKARGE